LHFMMTQSIIKLAKD